MPDLVPLESPEDQSLDALAARASALETAFRARVDELEQLRVSLAAFRVEYRQRVGRLHEELDDLELAIAEAELGELARQVPDTPGATDSTRSPAPTDTAPRLTTDGVRKLFRDVAKVIHPDLAHDPEARDRRHALMIEANRAYALGDEERLRWILQAWERSPEAVVGTGDEAARTRLVRRIAELEERLVLCAGELGAIKETPLWQLKAMVDEAAGRGKDLVRDMVARLRRDILVARNRLDAMQSRP